MKSWKSKSVQPQHGDDQQSSRAFVPLHPSGGNHGTAGQHPIRGPTPDTKPWGLKLLRAGTDPTVDIVAVHGLDGHRENTWTTEHGTLWLQDLLPDKIPNARIWTWGYDARTHSKSHWDQLSTKKLYDHGRELVFDLDGERRETDTHCRPLIFVAHSLGGIVVKNALLHSDRVREGHLEEQRSIKLSTYGIIFMGTPHQGGQGMSIGKILLNVAKVQGDTSDSLLKHLEEHSEELQRQMAEFTSIAKDFDIKFAYETKKTPVFGAAAEIIVPKWSAVVPGTPNAAEFGIDEDHMQMTIFSSAEDQGYKKVARTLLFMTQEAKSKVEQNWISERRMKLARSANETYQVPFSIRGVPIVSQYVDREDEMKAMDDGLLPHVESDRRKTFVLHGLSGIGKTQLALAFARKHKGNYSAIFWLDGQSQRSLQQSIASIAKRLPSGQISELARKYDWNDRKNIEEVIHEVLDWFGKSENSKWLLIYDNVDREISPEASDPEAYNVDQYLPPIDQGSVIITTCRSELRLGKAGMRVKTMTESEGLLLLSGRLGLPMTGNPHARLLFERVGGLPLALAQAGSYMFQTGISIPQYLESYNNTRKDLQTREAQSNIHEPGSRSVHTTCTVSFEKVKRKDQAAANMLQLWSCLDNRDIWFGLFNNGENPNLQRWSNPPKWFKETIRNKLDFNRAVSTLLAYSLIEANQDLESYAVHPVVHEWYYETLAANQRQELAWLAVTSVGFAVPMQQQRNYWVTQLRLMPHADRCCKSLTCAFDNVDENANKTSQEEDYARLCSAVHNIGILYSSQARMGEAEAMYELALAGYETVSHPDHTSTLDVVNNLGAIYYELGKMESAKAMYERALAGYEKAFGSEHPSILDISNNLAVLHGAMDNTDQAEALLEGALAGKEKLGSEHLSTLGTVNNLGSLYSDQGKMDKAEAMYKRALAGYEKALGMKHPSTLSAVNNLGILYDEQGRVEEAKKWYTRALAGFEKTVGSDHTSSLDIVNNLGVLYKDQGKTHEAENLYRRALKGYEKAFGPEHPSTLQTVSNLGDLYCSQGKMAPAKRMYDLVLAGFEKAYRPEHTLILHTFNSLGNLYSEQGKMDEAEEMYKRALAGYEKAHGLDHRLTLDTVNNLGSLYFGQGKMAEAEAMYKRALGGQEEVLGPDHKLTLETVNSLGELYFDQGKMDDAEAMYKRALEGNKMVLGQSHESTFETVNGLGNLYYKQEKIDKAKKLYKRALAEQEKSLAPDNQSTLETVNNLGNLYKDQGKMQKAEAKYKRALAGQEKMLGPEHESTLHTVNNLGLLYYDQDKMDDAENMYKRLLAGYEKVHGPEDESTLAAVNNLGAVYFEQKQMEKAKAMYKRALKGREKVPGSENESTFEIVRILGDLYKDQGKMEKAGAMYQRALAGYEKVLGPDHTSTLDTVYNLGLFYRQSKEHEKSLVCFARACKGYAVSRGADHPETIDAQAEMELAHRLAEEDRVCHTGAESM